MSPPTVGPKAVTRSPTLMSLMRAQRKKSVTTYQPPHAKKIVKTIKTIDGVNYIEASAKKGDNAYKYVVESDIDVREQVFYKLAKAGCPILESKPSTMTLEDIFINVVTQGTEVN